MLLRSNAYKDFVWGEKLPNVGSHYFKKYMGGHVIQFKRAHTATYSSPCFGEPGTPGSFAYHIKKMKYLSEFLGVLPRFVSTRGY